MIDYPRDNRDYASLLKQEAWFLETCILTKMKSKKRIAEFEASLKQIRAIADKLYHGEFNYRHFWKADPPPPEVLHETPQPRNFKEKN